ncbi:hypothetical protein ml_104 [Mollivirus sibericum]|uniref:hypothetical protein n=1 Tax=Mollivirus sibericum TaxID=1678078 RepID=UPI0006B2EF51|nr:hypothetical protein ml_104 [Mollivirus sibericum]ALD61906.1 hypothetical protein ml_104 [Mollivirus sibericum]
MHLPSSLPSAIEVSIPDSALLASALVTAVVVVVVRTMSLAFWCNNSSKPSSPVQRQPPSPVIVGNGPIIHPHEADQVRREALQRWRQPSRSYHSTIIW